MRIFVADTIDSQWFCEEFWRKFPKATYVDHLPDGRKPTVAPHPHGGLVLSRILMPLIDVDVEVHFIPMLNDEIAPVNAEDWMLDELEAAQPRPDDLVNCSWGMNRPKNEGIDRAWATVWMPWVAREAALRARCGYLLGFAAGNTNTGGLAYKDVGYPTRLMKGILVVAAIEKSGVVVEWSSDGNVTNADLGHYAWLVNPFTGALELGSGTSYACPSTLGTAGRLIVQGTIHTFDELVVWFIANTTWPKGFKAVDLPHPVFGYGQTMTAFEKVCRAHNAFELVGITPRMNQFRGLGLLPLDWFEWADLRPKRAA